jgi:hypothetical protein
MEIWIVWASGKFFLAHLTEEGARLEAEFHEHCGCQDVHIEKLAVYTYEQAQAHWESALKGT